MPNFCPPPSPAPLRLFQCLFEPKRASRSPDISGINTKRITRRWETARWGGKRPFRPQSGAGAGLAMAILGDAARFLLPPLRFRAKLHVPRRWVMPRSCPGAFFLPFFGFSSILSPNRGVLWPLLVGVWRFLVWGFFVGSFFCGSLKLSFVSRWGWGRRCRLAGLGPCDPDPGSWGGGGGGVGGII